jgi:outer membrane usher protein
MFPDGMRSYAPEIRGVAQQRPGHRAPGQQYYLSDHRSARPFTLQDVYPPFYGSDLECRLKKRMVRSGI